MIIDSWTEICFFPLQGGSKTTEGQVSVVYISAGFDYRWIFIRLCSYHERPQDAHPKVLKTKYMLLSLTWVFVLYEKTNQICKQAGSLRRQYA